MKVRAFHIGAAAFVWYLVGGIVLAVQGDDGWGPNLSLAMVWALVLYLDRENTRLRTERRIPGSVVNLHGVATEICAHCAENLIASGACVRREPEPARPSLVLVKSEGEA